MIQFGGLQISLDRREPASDIDFISHAHSDHIGAAKSSKRVLASDQTAELISCAYGIEVSRSQLPDGATLLDAGHMLGSKQLCMYDAESGIQTIYTGDFQTAYSRTSPKIETKEADCVIMDSTFYSQSFVFEHRADEEEALAKWVSSRMEHGIVLLSAYRMGKAQDIISILNDHQITPVVSSAISEINKIYKKNGVRLDCISSSDPDHAEALSGTFVGIIENRRLEQMKLNLQRVHGRHVHTAYATGFAKVMRMNSDAQFVISDHSDFMQSMEYIDATGAADIYTYGANAAQFAANLSSKGYKAESLPKKFTLK